jgi:hypothetical protein
MKDGRYAQVFKLLVASSLQVSVVWQGPATPLAGKLDSTIVTFLALAVARDKINEVEQVIVAACVAGGGTVLTIVLSHLSASSTTATVLSVGLATSTQVRRLLALQLARGAASATELGVVEGRPTTAPPPQAPGGPK